MKSSFKSALFFALLIAGLELLMRGLDLSPAAFATPFEIIRKIPRFVMPDAYALDIVMTFVRSIIAFVVAIPVGLFIGYAAVKTPFIAPDLRSVVDFLRSIPGTSLIPVFFVVFGIGETSKIAAAVYGASLTMAIATIIGLGLITRERRYNIETLYGKKAASFLRFELPDMMPTLIVGLRTAISLSLVLVTVAEMFMGTETGLGSVIMDTRYSGRIPSLYTAIVMTGVLGFILNKMIGGVETLIEQRYPGFN